MRNTLGVRTESTGWRDSWISDKHRSWGYDLPASDIDFMLLEYDNMKPITLVEHKTVGCWKQFGRETVLRWHAPVATLATMAGLPSYLCLYEKHPAAFYVLATNEIAERVPGRNGCFGSEMIPMSERQYVAFLYHLRNRPLPSVLVSELESVAIQPHMDSLTVQQGQVPLPIDDEMIVEEVE
jgi:hypothetical protein